MKYRVIIFYHAHGVWSEDIEAESEDAARTYAEKMYEETDIADEYDDYTSEIEVQELAEENRDNYDREGAPGW